MSRPLYVAQPIMPSLDDFTALIAEIWQTKVLTNGGPFHQRLETALSAYLDVPTAMLFNNGTIALMVALRMFDLPPGGEVITTPLTFAATAHAISWNGQTPVFADISRETLTLDPAAVERAITPKTCAILAVHVYGIICDVEGLQAVADKHGIPLIYDAAHAFGAALDGLPIAHFGNASVFSFHATKLYNTFEGGLIATPDAADIQRIRLLRNFGILNEEEVLTIGINGKVNELQAAIGLLNLDLIEGEQRVRRSLRQNYTDRLRHVRGIRLAPEQANVVNSEQYFPVIIDPQKFGRTRDDVYNSLKTINIFSRKYFHPICTDFVPYRGSRIVSFLNIPYAEIVKSQILCLPFHSGVDDRDVDDICNVFA